jgi:hypothetical protein
MPLARLMFRGLSELNIASTSIEAIEKWTHSNSVLESGNYFAKA